MDWFAAVDIYCERTSAGFWAEPVNALTNIAFVLAALWAATEAVRRDIRNPVVWVLIGLAAMIGVGSFLFHTFANRWSELVDIVPIWSFVALFVLAAMHFVGGLPVARVLRIAGLVAVAAGLVIWLLAFGEGQDQAAQAADPLNGSGQYAPALLALAVFAVVSWRQGHPGARWVAASLGVFVLSLAARTADRDICGVFPLGTHFLWHLLNGLMIALLLQMLVRTGGFRRG